MNIDIQTEQDLIDVSLLLITDRRTLTKPEKELIKSNHNRGDFSTSITAIRKLILKGKDPLGDLFSDVRPTKERRVDGAVYTPHLIVKSIVNWAYKTGTPKRFIDPGAGSGRFVLEAAKLSSSAHCIAIEKDPLAALILRANVDVLGLRNRIKIIVDDYRNIKLPKIKGVTAFIGNPPYVRHHSISEYWKEWFLNSFSKYGIKASALSGLHAHFFLKTMLLSQPGDIGAFITSSEWLDVNYGKSLKTLFMEKLGGCSLYILEPSVEAFPGTATTASISCFKVGQSSKNIKIKNVKQINKINGLNTGRNISSSILLNERKWSTITKPKIRIPDNMIELGELFRVHRGQVTGANKIWIAGQHTDLIASRFKIHTVTRAKDLISAGQKLVSLEQLKQVVDLPPDLDELLYEEKKEIEAFLKWAKSQGVNKSYTASHRKAWWSVGLREPAPILCTYMGRRPPQFTLNPNGAKHINIAHGLYPRQPISNKNLIFLGNWLNNNVSRSDGRTYSGGLTKFEPKEVERLLIPEIEF